jgi:hypothetical protein
MTQMPDTLTLDQVEYLRCTLPQKSMAGIMPLIDVDSIVRTQVQVINGVEVFMPTEKDLG